MKKRWRIDIDFIEEGDIYFFYKPKKGVEKTKGFSDVSRFFIVLDAYGEAPPRYIVMGGKKMPEVTDGKETSWGFIQMVGGRGFETLKSAKKYKKGASRPAGEGVYSIVIHRDHSHLLYSLELPKRLGDVQNAFNIEREGNYILLERPIEIAPKNPDIPFSNFNSLKDAHNLDKRGTEILLIGVSADIGRLGIKVEKEDELLNAADIFSELKLDKKLHPVTSLISGDWE